MWFPLLVDQDSTFGWDNLAASQGSTPHFSIHLATDIKSTASLKIDSHDFLTCGSNFTQPRDGALL